jgi:dTDP-4-amino-4,6-dideoxygalactose transaminase
MSFARLFEFEARLSNYTGAPYVVVTDCCTHAIELCLRYDRVRRVRFSAFTYLSIPQVMNTLDISYGLTDEQWQGEYMFHGTRIWDSARRLQQGMYRPGSMQCVSFGHTKPLELGRCGAVLLDDKDAYSWISRARSDGRDLAISPWTQQQTFALGWHYCPSLETCALGIQKLAIHVGVCQSGFEYPDLRTLNINHAHDL